MSFHKICTLCRCVSTIDTTVALRVDHYIYLLGGEAALEGIITFLWWGDCYISVEGMTVA